MTYCVAIMIDSGMIFASDTRTNAGVDNIATFRKMRVFTRPNERVLVTLSSGNLSLTQSAINLLEQRARANENETNIMNATSMFDVATLLGSALREVRERDEPYLAQSQIDSSANFLLGGQIQGERQRLFHIYSAGNFIEATEETSYFQIGEIKYGKPIIDRVIKQSTSITDAVKCTLVSFDSTMRSNISVGLPIDLVTYEANSLQIKMQRRIDESDPYFSMIHTQWGEGLRKIFAQLPDPYWDSDIS